MRQLPVVLSDWYGKSIVGSERPPRWDSSFVEFALLCVISMRMTPDDAPARDQLLTLKRYFSGDPRRPALNLESGAPSFAQQAAAAH
jgi:hypothetical protein